LFRDYHKVNFILFHGGYPYIKEIAVLAKYFPNVYLDACWLSDISVSGYKRALNEWIELVPSNKILAYGGDHTMIEHTYASLLLAKDLISDVFTEKIMSGYFNINGARAVMRKILNLNACNLYSL
jgi:predicted TIM-barrel fold metal-dependent hydrolase